MGKITGKTVSTNLLWRFLERFGAQGVTFVVSLVLARILEPKDYGTVAIITVILTILQVFVDSGFGNALIQKKDSDDTDFSTVFFFNVFLSGILYFALFLFAPVISGFYSNSDLTLLIRVAGTMLFISALKNVQQAYVSKHLMFKKFFFSTLFGTLGAAALGIVLAFNGFGVWALVIQLLFNNLVDMMVLWITVRWRPKFVFNFDRLKTLFNFGWKLLVSSLITTVYNEIKQLIIGKMYTGEDLAFYNRGHQLPYYATTSINSSIDSVMLPVMANYQDDKNKLRAITQRAIKTSCFIIWPMMAGLSACSFSLIKLVLTEKWLPCVPFLIIFCFVYSMYPITTANLNAIKAMGKSNVFLKLEIIKKFVGIIVLFITMWFGPIWIALGGLFVSIFAQAINSLPNKMYLDYSLASQIKDILPSVLLSLFMGICVFFVTFLGLSDVATLAIQIPLGTIIYIGLARLFRLDSLDYAAAQIKRFFGKSA